VIDPRKFLPGNRGVDYWVHHTGGLWLGAWIRGQIIKRVECLAFDITFVNHGELVDASLVEELGRHGPVVNYNVDDPFGGRDGSKWRLYLSALPSYDLVTVVRKCNVSEALSGGARDVLLVSRSADEVAHAPRNLSQEERLHWSSEVVFVGTWMPERGPFMARLIKLGVPLTIYGLGWHKATEWPALRPYWHGPGLYNDEDYAKAVRCAKVCLGLLSKGNRDLVTQRSFEIPYLGGVLCAERTPEHEALYRDGEEAVFWSTAEECADKCRQLLANDDWRQHVAERGRARCIANKTTNEHVLARILERVRTLPKMELATA
jgi:spore maturation protein CgeB